MNLKRELAGISVTLNLLKISVVGENSGLHYIWIDRLAQLLSLVCFSCKGNVAGKLRALDVKFGGYASESPPLRVPLQTLLT